MSGANINQTLADALGVQLQGTSTIGFTLRVRAGRLPLLTVHRHVFDASQVKPITERLELRPVGEPQAKPLDLDAMAAAASARLEEHIEASASKHLRAMGITPFGAREIFCRAGTQLSYDDIVSRLLPGINDMFKPRGAAC